MAPKQVQIREVQIPAALIDEFGDIVALRDAFAPTEKRYQQLRKQFEALLGGAGAEEEFTPSGERFSLNISARSIDRYVPVKVARKRLGLAAFMECCSVTLKSLENFLLKPEIDALAVSERTGSRSYVPLPLQK